MHIIFLSISFENLFDVTVERVKIAILNPNFKVSTLGLEIAVSTHSTVTENRILKSGAMKNIIFI